MGFCPFQIMWIYFDWLDLHSSTVDYVSKLGTTFLSDVLCTTLFPLYPITHVYYWVYAIGLLGKFTHVQHGIPWYPIWFFAYPSEKWWSSDQLGWWNSQLNVKIHVPNHQPVCIYIYIYICPSYQYHTYIPYISSILFHDVPYIYIYIIIPWYPICHISMIKNSVKLVNGCICLYMISQLVWYHNGISFKWLMWQMIISSDLA